MEYAPMIYVIIPVYNAEKYVSMAIDSVLAQPYKKISIVCVDDGSVDGSLPILRQYEAINRNVYVIHQTNCGVAVARNTGLEFVLTKCDKNDYLIFLDADDLWAQNVITADEVFSWRDFDCIGFTSVRCSNDLTHTSIALTLSETTQSGGSMSVWCHGDAPMGAMLYCCNLINSYDIRFISGLRYAEDKIFKYTCLFLAESIQIRNKVLYCYRMNILSAMHSRSYGVDYMPAIINAYLNTYHFLKPFENAQRGSARFCNTLAGIHAIEMAEEHYQMFRSPKILQHFLSKHPQIPAAIDSLDRKDLAEANLHQYELYTFSQRRFRLLHYVKGLQMLLRRMILICKPLLVVMDKKRYPNRNIYI